MGGSRSSVSTHFIRVSMPKRRSVHNHLKTVHAIAMCNLCEFAGGVCMEASSPQMDTCRNESRLSQKKAETNLYAICDIGTPDWDNIEVQVCHVSVRDQNDVEVMTADIDMKVSKRK